MRTLTALEKWSYAIGNMPFAVKDAAFVNFVVFYYTQVQGLSGTLAGLAAFIALSWDAITDPVVGSWSDTLRSRWGRRHPPILLGGLPFALMFIALFAPPQGMSEIATFFWFTLVAMLLRTFLTIYFIPYSAMGAELSTDYDERTTIAKARVTMAWIAGMAMPAIGFTVFFTAGDDGDGRLIASNYVGYGVFSAVLAAAALLFCVWGTRTVIARLPTASGDVSGLSLQRTLDDFRAALSNRNFRITLGASLAFGMAAGVYSTLALYFGTYFWEFSSEQLAGLVVPTAIGTLITFALLSHLQARFDKASLMGLACLGIMLNTFALIGMRLFDLLPENGHPIIYPLMLLSTGFGVITVASVQILGISLTADILDEQELAHGQRQEGVFFAASTFVQKTTTGIGTLIAGIVVEVSGLESGAAPGTVPAESLNVLGWFNIGIIATLAFTAYLFTRYIALGRKEHREIRRALESQASA